MTYKSFNSPSLNWAWWAHGLLLILDEIAQGWVLAGAAEKPIIQRDLTELALKNRGTA
jgi:hypothetical protein